MGEVGSDGAGPGRFGASDPENGAGASVFGAGAILGGEPAPLESAEWHFAAQVEAIKRTCAI